MLKLERQGKMKGILAVCDCVQEFMLTDTAVRTTLEKFEHVREREYIRNTHEIVYDSQFDHTVGHGESPLSSRNEEMRIEKR